MKRYSIAEARNHLPGLVRAVETGSPVELTRRGKPIAVLMALPDFERLREGRRGFMAAYQDFLRRHPDFAANAIEPEEWLEGARDTSTGRDFTW
ncbi:MAG TPA: type II toxin-antitoxin system Phd/YefM family antitoxin [Thermoanaerobaculia bacterium]|nr:type II toxin-antitoxin system Phd/YefM family antitoxin [Thermoanaerobaculia bacterium]